ncbi:MAG: hypothetical protein JRI43_00275 [Deltaproteobacteria bacterium]|nr:hypothetical protein [Deltaproteobacteria bacterium]
MKEAVHNILCSFYFHKMRSITVLPSDLEEYQAKRLKGGISFATVDMELSLAKTMVTKAFDNDLVDGHIIKAFRPVKRKLKFGNRGGPNELDSYLRK